MRTYTFELEDKSYTLKYDYNAICDMEELSGKPIQSLFSETEIGLNSVRILLWGGLKWKNNGITKQQVGFMIQKMLELGIYEEVVNKAMLLLPDSLPQQKGEVKENEGE